MQRGLNIVRAGGVELLLTHAGGNAIHLTRETGPEEPGREAVLEHYLDGLARVYDNRALQEAKWAETTMCGRQWILMASEEDTDYCDAVFAPTCRRCMAIMDKLFPKPDLDERFGLVVQIISDTVAEHGYAEMWNVPGDHQAALRQEVRSAVRKRTGFGMQTLVHGTMVLFVCEPIHESHAEERNREYAEVMNRMFTDSPGPPLPTPWRLYWDTWANS